MTAHFSRYSPMKMFRNMEELESQQGADHSDQHGHSKLAEHQKRYDISQILLISRGDDSFVKSLIKMFIVQTPLYIDKILAFYQDNDYKSMGEVAHQLKQSVYAMGVHGLKKTVFQIVHAGRTETVTDDFGQLLHQLKSTADLVIEDLKRDFNIC